MRWAGIGDGRIRGDDEDDAEIKERLSDAGDITVRAMIREEIEELLEDHEGVFEFKLTKLG